MPLCNLFDLVYAGDLAPRLCLWCATPSTVDPLRLRPLQVRRGDPRLVVSLCARSDSGTISANNGDLVRRVDLLGLLAGCLCALAALAAAFLLWEQGRDPGVVDEVDGSAETGEQDKVEKDTVRGSS